MLKQLRFVTGGVRIDSTPMDQAVSNLIHDQRGGGVHLCNAFTVALAYRDEKFKALLNSSWLNLADGMPLIWIAKYLRIPQLDHRVYGPDLMARTLAEGCAHNTKHYLFGSTEDVLEELQRQIARRWPKAIIAGHTSPPFRSLSDAELAVVIKDIESVNADIVWVGMGTPKQDYLVERMSNLAQQKFVAIGAAFDFLAGTKRQAPGWMQANGLEWVHRLLTEPRRLWRRYLFGNIQFIWANVRDRPHVCVA